jgi:hypothetical protein
LIELSTAEEIKKAKEELSHVTDQPTRQLRKSVTYASEDEPEPESHSTTSRRPVPRSSSLPLNFDPRKLSQAFLPVIEDHIEEDLEEENEPTQEETSRKSRRSLDSSPTPGDSKGVVSPRRPSSANASRKRSQLKSSEMIPSQPLSSSKGKKSPRKVSVQGKTMNSTHPLGGSGGGCDQSIPISTSTDAGTTIDLNLTRLSRVHRFTQTDMFGSLVDQVAELTTGVEEREKLIQSLKKENLVCLSVSQQSLIILFRFSQRF